MMTSSAGEPGGFGELLHAVRVLSQLKTGLWLREYVDVSPKGLLGLDTCRPEAKPLKEG